MDKRRLQKTGGSSLSMTLPKHWVERLGLHHQDLVVAHMQRSGSLLVRTEQAHAQNWRAIVSLEHTTISMLPREMVALYITGIDEIEYQGETITPEQRAQIRQLSQSLIGFEIVDESATKIVVKNIFDVSKFPLPETMTKMFLIAESMFSDALRAILDNHSSLADDIIHRDAEIDKLRLVIKRQFHSLLQDKAAEEEIGLDRLDLNYFEGVAVQLERIADHAVKIARAIPANVRKEKNTAATTYQRLARTMLDLLRQSAEMMRQTDKLLAHQILDQDIELEKSLERLKHKKQPKLASDVILEDSLDRLRGHIMNIAELTIDRAMSRSLHP